MSNLVVPERLESYIANTFTGGTDSDWHAHAEAVIDNKYQTQYGIRKRVRDKIESGEYVLTGNTTLQSVLDKADAKSTELYDSFVNQEFNLCVSEDGDLG